MNNYPFWEGRGLQVLPVIDYGPYSKRA